MARDRAYIYSSLFIGRARWQSCSFVRAIHPVPHNDVISASPSRWKGLAAHHQPSPFSRFRNGSRTKSPEKLASRAPLILVCRLEYLSASISPLQTALFLPCYTPEYINPRPIEIKLTRRFFDQRNSRTNR